MKARFLLAGIVLATGLAAAVPSASAQGIVIDQGGVRIVPQAQEVPPPGYDRGPPRRGYDEGEYRGISQREARRIARSAGIVETFDVGRRGPMWVVRGGDYRGRVLRVTISARTGEIVDVQRRRG